MTETTTPALVPLDGHVMPVLASVGAERRAHEIARRADRALTWLREVSPRDPRFTLYVLGPRDWSAVAEVPIYGMPMSLPGKVVTSPEPAPWWLDYLEALRPYVPDAGLTGLLGDPPDFTTMADLVTVHEITHLCHDIDPVTWASEFPADWLMELFANLGLYGYVAEHEPEHLPLLTGLAATARDAASAPWPRHDLAAMAESMGVSVPNYVWFEFMLIGLAESIWNRAGRGALVAYQSALGDPRLNPRQVLERLHELDATAADAVRTWPADG